MGDLALKNRIFMAPMTRARGGPDCIANSTVAEYYAQRADAGLIISEGTHVSKMAIGWCNVPGVYKPEHAAAWKVRFFKVTAHLRPDLAHRRLPQLFEERARMP